MAQKVKWYKENEHIKKMVYGQVASDTFFPVHLIFHFTTCSAIEAEWDHFYFHNHSHHAPKDRRSIRRCSYHRLELQNQPNTHTTFYYVCIMLMMMPNFRSLCFFIRRSHSFTFSLFDIEHLNFVILQRKWSYASF